MPANAIVNIPEATSLAKPLPRLLLAARYLIQQKAELQALFRQSLEDRWDVEQLSLSLEEPLQDGLPETNDPQEIVQVARYLADEYQQVGDTMLLVSRETGKAIGRVTDEHLWTPPPVPREDGRMVQPLPRLRPELEAALVMRYVEKDREKRILSEIVPNLNQTELVKQEGDPRLLPLTRAGRETLVGSLRERLPTVLAMASGSAGNFLSHFDVREDDPSAGQALAPSTATAHIVTRIQDPKAMNLRFDRSGSLYGRVANGWGREIAWALAVAAKQHFQPMPKPYTSLSPEETRDSTIWVGEPDTLEALTREVFLERPIVLPVNNAPTIALLGRVGSIVIRPLSYACHGRELFDRWEVAAKFDYTLWVDWAQLRAFDLDNVPHFAAVEQSRV
jgi:hypothetical protein